MFEEDESSGQGAERWIKPSLALLGEAYAAH